MAAYTTIVLMNLSVWNNPNRAGTGFSLDVVQSVHEGKSKGVGVEKVSFKDGGAKRYGRPLSLMDFKKVKEHWSEILAWMNNPPEVKPPPEPEPLTGGSLGGGGIGGGKIADESDTF